MTTSGTWRRRRNLDNATLVKVEAELRAQSVSGPATVPLPLIPPPPPFVAAPNAAAPTVMVPPPPPRADGIPPPPPPVPVTDNPFGFRALMRKVDGHTGEGGRLSAEAMRPVHAEFGATGWPDYVAKCTAQIPALMARIDGLLR